MNLSELCREIGNFFGVFYTEREMIYIDAGDKVYQYNTYEELLLDWVDALIKSQKSGNGNWEKEIEFIRSLSLKKAG